MVRVGVGLGFHAECGMRGGGEGGMMRSDLEPHEAVRQIEGALMHHWGLFSDVEKLWRDIHDLAIKMSALLLGFASRVSLVEEAGKEGQEVGTMESVYITLRMLVFEGVRRAMSGAADCWGDSEG